MKIRIEKYKKIYLKKKWVGWGVMLP